MNCKLHSPAVAALCVKPARFWRISMNASFDHITKLINAGRVHEALETINRTNDNSPWMQNARAVCLMRSGQSDKALSVLTALVYQPNSVVFRQNVPEILKLNLVTAMLLSGNVSGAMTVMQQVHQDSPMRTQIQNAVNQWKRSRPLMSRIAFSCGILPYNSPVPLDFLPGQLEDQVHAT